MILAVNTSTMQFSIALLKESGVVAAEYLISPSTKDFRGFMPGLHSLFKASGTKTGDLKAIVVTIGPGSFTGLRVGLSTAKGMAHGLGIPLVGISGLDAMAAQPAATEYPVCPLITSRKGEVFAALYQRGPDGELSRQKEEASFKFEEIKNIIDETTIFLGNDYESQWRPLKDALGSLAMPAPVHLWNLKASVVGALGLKRFQKNDFDNILDLVPRYYRPPDIRANPFRLISQK